MKFPKIPPNCDCFIVGEVTQLSNEPGAVRERTVEKALFIWPNVGEKLPDRDHVLDDYINASDLNQPLGDEERKGIAAITRCHCLDEAEKWATLPVNDCKNFDEIAYWKTEAEALAEQWKKWGRGEPWE